MGEISFHLLQNDNYSSALVDMYRWLQVNPGSDSLFEAHSGVSMQMMVPIKDAVAKRNTAEAAAMALTSANLTVAGLRSGEDSGGSSDAGGPPIVGESVTPVRKERDPEARRYGVTPTPLRRGARNIAWPSPRLMRVRLSIGCHE